jgi:hypothetical protein
MSNIVCYTIYGCPIDEYACDGYHAYKATLEKLKEELDLNPYFQSTYDQAETFYWFGKSFGSGPDRGFNDMSDVATVPGVELSDAVDAAYEGLSSAVQKLLGKPTVFMLVAYD